MPPAEARALLIETYNGSARQEALLRAFIAEFDNDLPAARFWVAVYGLIAGPAELDRDRPGNGGPGSV